MVVVVQGEVAGKTSPSGSLKLGGNLSNRGFKDTWPVVDPGLPDSTTTAVPKPSPASKLAHGTGN